MIGRQREGIAAFSGVSDKELCVERFGQKRQRRPADSRARGRAAPCTATTSPASSRSDRAERCTSRSPRSTKHSIGWKNAGSFAGAGSNGPASAVAVTTALPTAGERCSPPSAKTGPASSRHWCRWRASSPPETQRDWQTGRGALIGVTSCRQQAAHARIEIPQRNRRRAGPPSRGHRRRGARGRRQRRRGSRQGHASARRVRAWRPPPPRVEGSATSTRPCGRSDGPRKPSEGASTWPCHSRRLASVQSAPDLCPRDGAGARSGHRRGHDRLHDRGRRRAAAPSVRGAAASGHDVGHELREGPLEGSDFAREFHGLPRPAGLQGCGGVVASGRQPDRSRTWIPSASIRSR